MRDGCFIFGNSLLAPPLRAEQLGFCDMRQVAAGRRRQSLLDQLLRVCDIGRGRLGHLIEHATRERDR